MLTVRVMEKDDSAEGSQSLSTPDTSDLLLDNNMLRHVIVQAVQFVYARADEVTVSEGRRMYDALRTVGDLRCVSL